MREFHEVTHKKEGDRVKIPRHPASEDRGYYFGTVIHVGPSDNLMVHWDEKIPFMPRTSEILPAIRV